MSNKSLIPTTSSALNINQSNFQIHDSTHKNKNNLNNSQNKNYSTYNLYSSYSQTPVNHSVSNLDRERDYHSVQYTQNEKHLNSVSNLNQNQNTVNLTSSTTNPMFSENKPGVKNSHSMLANYKNTASSIKDIKSNLVNQNLTADIRSNSSNCNPRQTHQKSQSISQGVTNISNNMNISREKLEIKNVIKTNLKLNPNPSYLPQGQTMNLNSGLNTTKIKAFVGISGNSIINGNTGNIVNNQGNNQKSEKNVINSSVEFEKYKSSLLEKLSTNLNFKKNLASNKNMNQNTNISENYQRDSQVVNTLASNNSSNGLNSFNICNTHAGRESNLNNLNNIIPTANPVNNCNSKSKYVDKNKKTMFKDK